MLPTKGYFQDIECPYYNSSCGRPYCHFRHRKKHTEVTEETLTVIEQTAIPTYRPTPKTELANIHNSKSHIPISYVPDLAFRQDRTTRPLPKFEKPTYKPTPLSLLSSANKRSGSLEENEEHTETIKGLKLNIANNEYDPLKSEINFEDLSNEFDLIDEIINGDGKSEIEEQIKPVLHEEKCMNEDIDEIKSDTEKAKLKLSASVIDTRPSSSKEPSREKHVERDKTDSEKNIKQSDKREKSDHICEKLSNSRETNSEKHSKSSEKTIKHSEKKEKRDSSSEKCNKPSERNIKQSDKKQKIDSNSEKCNKSDSKKQKTVVSDKDKISTETLIKTESKKEKNTGHTDKNKSNSEKKRTSKEKSVEKNEKREKSLEKHRNKTSKSSSRERSNSKSSDKSKSSTREKHGSEMKEKHGHSKKTNENSSKDKRKKEPEKEIKLKHNSKHKNHERSRSKSQHRDKEKDKKKHNTDRSKEKYKSDSNKSDHKRHKTKEKEKKKPRRHSSSSESREISSDSETSRSSISSDNFPHDGFPSPTQDNLELNVSDIDLDDEDETMRECYKIFNEYKPEHVALEPPRNELEEVKEIYEEIVSNKKRTAHANAEIIPTYSKIHPPTKPKSLSTPGQILTNRFKIAKLSQASKEQEHIANEVRNMVQETKQGIKRPAPTLLEAARQYKVKRMEAKLKSKPTNIVDDIIKGTTTPSVSQPKIVPLKKIAAVSNVALLQKAKERISAFTQQAAVKAVKTVAQTQKSGRTAHVPEFSLSDIPDVLQADNSKLPVNVRTRFLTMIGDECVKLYMTKNDAYTRALNEEFACYEKCKVVATYRNSAMLAVNRLRKEIQDRQSRGLGLMDSGEASKKESSDFSGEKFYNHVKKWVLSEEDLNIHGYPRESEERGKARVKSRAETDYSIDQNQRKCCRCSRIYQVDDDGWPLYEEECLYHPLKKRTIRGEQVYLCCKSTDDSGCATSDTHVSDGLESHLLEGYQTTLEPEYDEDPRSYAVYALDCEMCYTTKGLELTRVTIVDTNCKTVYESLVKPLNPIIDYNTRFSGITKEQMNKTSTSILQVQANILHLCNSKTILVGHSLESDMKALKIVHDTVIDTSVLFPHKMGLPHKRALKALASEFLKKIIQNDVSGHDSAEDAITCMELIKWKLKEELKVRTK